MLRKMKRASRLHEQTARETSMSGRPEKRGRELVSQPVTTLYSRRPPRSMHASEAEVHVPFSSPRVFGVGLPCTNSATEPVHVSMCEVVRGPQQQTQQQRLHKALSDRTRLATWCTLQSTNNVQCSTVLLL
jgi:hypothetical protein